MLLNNGSERGLFRLTFGPGPEVGRMRRLLFALPWLVLGVVALPHWASADATQPLPLQLPDSVPVLLAGAVAMVVLLALVAWVLARRARRADNAPMTQRTMAPPVSRKQVTEMRGPQPLLDVVGDAERSHTLGDTMIRIGRHDENDIQLASQTVHRYHAVLHLTPQQGHVITDLSGPEGNGVIVRRDARTDSPSVRSPIS